MHHDGWQPHGRPPRAQRPSLIRHTVSWEAGAIPDQWLSNHCLIWEVKVHGRGHPGLARNIGPFDRLSQETASSDLIFTMACKTPDFGVSVLSTNAGIAATRRKEMAENSLAKAPSSQSKDYRKGNEKGPTPLLQESPLKSSWRAWRLGERIFLASVMGKAGAPQTRDDAGNGRSLPTFCTPRRGHTPLRANGRLISIKHFRDEGADAQGFTVRAAAL
jgi:hypothetical protein